MSLRPLLASATFLAVLISSFSLPTAESRQKPPADQPQDLIVAMDVSDSMVHDIKSDPQGIRWDGVQFLIDTAAEKDRICLVLFSGDAAVLTKWLGDGKGFLQMGEEYDNPRDKKKIKGRQLLKNLVAELQSREEKLGTELQADPKKGNIVDRFYTFEKEVLPSLGRRFVLHNYTSVVEALDIICHKAKLLEELRKDHQPMLFLFTDGQESFDVTAVEKLKGFAGQKEKGHHFLTTPKDYAYMKKLHDHDAILEKLKGELQKAKNGEKARDELRAAQAGRERMLKETVLEEHTGKLRGHRVRTFTFALGGYCDEQLLRAIADETNRDKAATGRISAYYHVKTNVQLLERLQRVCWELRHHWVRQHPGERRGDRERFALPVVEAGIDLGLLLYRDVKTGPESKRGAWAPAEKELSLNQNGRPRSPEAKPLESRSHLFWPKFQGKGKQFLDIGGADRGACRCVSVVRTDKLQFSFMDPPSQASYTPLDAIPFRIKFNALTPAFKIDQFEVRARLTPVDQPGRALPAPREILLEPDAQAGEFQGEIILDPAPTKRDKDLHGAYEVQVVIRAREGLLKGADRELPLRTIRCVDYPTLVVPDRPLVVTNTGKGPFQSAVAVSVPVIRGRNPMRTVGTIRATLDEGVKRKGGGEVAASKFRPAPEKIDLRGGQGTFQVELPAAAWSRLPPGKYEGGKISFRAPWSEKDSPVVGVVVEKVPWDLIAPPAVDFDFSRRADKELVREVAVKLGTPAGVEELVWLSTNKVAAEPGQEGDFQLNGPAGQAVKLKVKGLGRALATDVNGTLEKTEPHSLTLYRAEDLPLGECSAKLYLVGPAVKPVEVPIRVSRRRFKLQAPKEIVFDLSSKKNDKGEPREIPVALDTNLDTDEEVWLSDSPTGAASVKDRDLDFLLQVEGGKRRKIPVAGLGKQVVVRGLTTKESSKVAITLSRPREKLLAGWYKSKLYLVGRAVEPHELTIKVKVDQPIVFLVGSDGKASRRIDELPLVGLAGRTTACALMVRTELEENSPATLYDTLARELTNNPDRQLRVPTGDSLAPAFESAKDRLMMTLNIPASVREGIYQTRLGLNLSPDKMRPLYLELPIRLQVLHFAVHPRERGAIKLELKQDPGMRAAKTIELTTEAKRDEVVRWSVERNPLPRRGLLQPLDEKDKNRLDVLYNKISVIEEKGGKPAGPNTPLDPGGKCSLTIQVDCSGLAPGRYHTGLRFRSSVKDQPVQVEGFPEDVAVEVLVPGRDLEVTHEAMQATGSRPKVDARVPVRVTVTSHGCPPGEGRIWPVDSQGKAIGPFQLIDAKFKVNDVADPQDPALHRTQFLVYVTPNQAGPNTYLVTWPRFFPANEKEGASRKEVSNAPKGELPQLVTVVANGRIEVKPAVGFVGEEVRVRASVVPAAGQAAGGFSLLAAHPDMEPVGVQLRDSEGRGRYTGSLQLTKPGLYTLTLPGSRTWQLDPTEARAGFVLDRPTQVAEMRFGGGSLMGLMLFWDQDLEHVSLRDMIRLENKEAAECHWRAKLLYPRHEHDLPRIVQGRNLDTVDGGEFDDKLHLESKLTLQQTSGAVEAGPDKTFEGVLKNGQVFELGLDSALSEDARYHLYQGEGDHPTLNRANGMLVELELEWRDRDGMRFGKRTVRVPVVVITKSWRWRGAVAGMIYAIMAGLLFWVGRGTYRRWARNASNRSAEDDTDGSFNSTNRRSKEAKKRGEEPTPDEPASRQEETLPGEFT